MIAKPVSAAARPDALSAAPPASFYDADSYDMHDSLGYQLATLVVTMRREVDLRMAAHGLTDAQWKPLWYLTSGRATTPQELSRCTLSDAGAMTRLLDRLVAKGLVQRERSDTDRRVVQLTLTPAGAAAAAEVPRVLAEVNNQFLQGFSAAEWQQLQGLVARMQDNGQTLREHLADAAPAGTVRPGSSGNSNSSSDGIANSFTTSNNNNNIDGPA